MTGVNLQTRRAYLAALEDRTARLEKEQDQQAQLAVATERTRIAREVHDIVTHSLSVMVALADGAAAAAPSPVRAGQAIGQVAATGRQAIGEMRRLVDTLRIDEKGADHHPAPGIGQLDDLLTQARSAGLPASLVVEGRAPAHAGSTAGGLPYRPRVTDQHQEARARRNGRHGPARIHQRGHRGLHHR